MQDVRSPPPADTSPAAIARAAGECLHPKPQWVLDAEADPALSFVSREWEKSAREPGAYFDHGLADKIVAAWPNYFRHTEGRWYNRPFALATWQEATVRLLVGWRNEEGYRLYRRLLLWVGKKNGKTEFLAALALLFWLFDREPGGQGFAFARNEKQAKIVFEKMRTMIGMLPNGHGKLVKTFKKSFYCPEMGRSIFELLPGSVKGRHGISASVIVGDEMHEWADDELATTLHQSTAARSQPIELFGSTAGVKGRGYGWDLWEETQSLIDGRLFDVGTLSAVFAADPEDDWTDERVWRKANPNLGISPTLTYLRAECAKAKDNPRLEANFRRYHLNQWVSSLTRWIPIVRWDRCAPGADNRWKEFQAKMRGRKCWSALDLSKTRDVTALVHLFPPELTDPQTAELVTIDKAIADLRLKEKPIPIDIVEGRRLLTRSVLIAKFFVPEATIDERVRRDRVKYDQWQKIGALEATPGDWVDQNWIKAVVQEDSTHFEILALGYDPWGATKLAQELIDEGAPAIEVRQGIPSLGEASAEFEKDVFAGLIDHGGHPVLRWMIENVTVFTDRNGNFKPDKAASSEKIDGVIATVMAKALSIKNVPQKPSVYETRGIRAV